MKVSLHTSALASLAHEGIFMPWLQRVAGGAAISARPFAVLVPQRADAYFLKTRALSAGMGLWGLHFLTPSDLRDQLRRHLDLPHRVPLREHSHLLLATAAERVAPQSADGPVNSVAVAPDQLLKAIDMIGSGGWNFAQAGPARLRPVVAEFDRLLDHAGFQMMHEADRAALQRAEKAGPIFAELFVSGFNALHWPLWPLLEAAVRLAETATVCLTEPRAEGEDLDAAWIGAWEETFGPAQAIADDAPPSPLAEALILPESATARTRRAEEPIAAVEFLAGLDTADQARAIVAKALQYLADPACERLGILFPAAGALPRRVAALLAELDVPHNDGVAHQAPGPLEDPAWPAWIALQESPRLPVLLRFLRACPDAKFGELAVEDAAEELQRVYQELLLDDLAVLTAYLAEHPREKLRALSAALRALPVLPERAALGELFTRTLEIFQGLGWTERAETLHRFALDWEQSRTLKISRRTWLRWLGETLVSWHPQRAEAGSHPYSRLHLLPYAQAESQAWTHLIATSLNEGRWPPTLEEAGFLGEDEITALNRQTHALNTRAALQGRQGEGHVAIQRGKALCLGPAQRRALAERQFLNTLESATIAVAATMQLHDEATPERPLNPSALFNRLHFCARGRAVSQQTLVALQGETARWLQKIRLWKVAPPQINAVQQTRVAFDARRVPGQAFGEYEFALRAKPRAPLRLYATQWESALSSPAQNFLAVLLGVKATRDDEETPWALAQGLWVHRWLRGLSGDAPPRTLSPLPAPAELRRRVRSAADTSRRLAEAALAAQRRALPDWWHSAWQQAWGAAEQLAESIIAIERRTHAATEWKIEDTLLPVGDGALSVRGRIDLLLSAGASLDDVWLVDYKTGNRKGLKLKDLASGDGVQLALYALALRAAGARQVGLSLITPSAPLDEPQLQLTGLDSLPGLWRGMLRMQESGVFGMRGALREEFGFGRDYPLATLAIDEDLLEEKWTLTHPDFGSEEIEP